MFGLKAAHCWSLQGLFHYWAAKSPRATYMYKYVSLSDLLWFLAKLDDGELFSGGISMHQDSPISYRVLMRTNKIDFTKEDSWVLASLMSLSVTTGSRRSSVAESIMDIFSAHPVLRLVTRVCLVRRMGCSNRLMVLSSDNRSGVPNTMGEGYNCFVSGNGSLFSLKPGAARFFSDAIEVVERYDQQGQPAQRSISRIAKMGLGAGITTGVFDNGQLVGFVFLNGELTRGDFDQDAMGLLLTHLNQVLSFKFAEYRLSRTYYNLNAAWPAAYIGGRLNTMKLADTIRQHFIAISGQEIEVSAKLTEKKADFLISHGNIGQIIARALSVFDNVSMVNVEVSFNGEHVLFDVSTSASQPGPLTASENVRMDDVIADARGLGLDMRLKNNASFIVAVLPDVASSEGSIDYSVEP
jgi:hypothetical protein